MGTTSRKRIRTDALKLPVSHGVVIEAFSTRRAEIVVAMEERGLGEPGDNARLADRAALMRRAGKGDVDKARLVRDWSRQAGELDFSPITMVAKSHRAATQNCVRPQTLGIEGNGKGKPSPQSHAGSGH